MNSRKESESIDKRNAAVMQLEATVKAQREQIAELVGALEGMMQANRPFGIDMPYFEGTKGDTAIAPEILAQPEYASYLNARAALAKVQS